MLDQESPDDGGGDLTNGRERLGQAKHGALLVTFHFLGDEAGEAGTQKAASQK